ncbi:hypothetical protein BSKO_13913 [Bryopsis sp. KO-2023]|nr:hypothetical protein BSKO_13913 [Bryopsis sp. KO-2023]
MAWVWDPLRLTFREAEVEELYDAWSECKSGAELGACVMGMITCSRILVAKGGQEGFWRMILVVGANLSWSLAGVCMAVVSGKRHNRLRPFLVGAVHCSGFLMGLTDIRVPSRVASVSDALVALLLQSPVSFTLFASIFLPLRFRDVLKTHIFFAISIVYFSSSDFCALPDDGESEGADLPPYSEIGERIDRIFEMTLFKSIRLNDEHRCSCEAVATFIFLVAGVFIPLLFSYFKEVISRCLFLRAWMPVEYRKGIWSSVKFGLEFSISLVIVGMQITWIVFRKL